LVLYGLHLWSRLHSVEQQLTALTTDERQHHGHR
jgi:hypothetical protein